MRRSREATVAGGESFASVESKSLPESRARRVAIRVSRDNYSYECAERGESPPFVIKLMSVRLFHGKNDRSASVTVKVETTIRLRRLRNLAELSFYPSFRPPPPPPSFWSDETLILFDAARHGEDQPSEKPGAAAPSGSA